MIFYSFWFCLMYAYQRYLKYKDMIWSTMLIVIIILENNFHIFHHFFLSTASYNLVFRLSSQSFRVNKTNISAFSSNFIKFLAILFFYSVPRFTSTSPKTHINLIWRKQTLFPSFSQKKGEVAIFRKRVTCMKFITLSLRAGHRYMKNRVLSRDTLFVCVHACFNLLKIF